MSGIAEMIQFQSTSGLATVIVAASRSPSAAASAPAKISDFIGFLFIISERIILALLCPNTSLVIALITVRPFLSVIREFSVGMRAKKAKRKCLRSQVERGVKTSLYLLIVTTEFRGISQIFDRQP